MIIVMKKRAKQKDLDSVIRWIESVGYRAHLSKGVERTIIGAVGDERDKVRLKAAENMSGVEKVMPILQPYKLASRETKDGNTIIKVGDVAVGGPKCIVIAGPCAVESEEQLMETALVVKKAGASMLRGGAFKPRTSPYSFQGLGEEGLKILAKAREETGLPVVTEVMSASDVGLIEAYADVLQIGARNTQNFALLKAVGLAKKPVLLKRGMMTTLDELLMSAEYIMASGNDNVMLCERGIRTFETAMRNTLDISAVPVLKDKTHLPVIVDPSHAIGQWKFVLPLAKAAVAVGADGLMIEVHCNPQQALSDGPQSLKPERFIKLMEEIESIANIVRN
ncbi:MAG: 3-deoxy-7-phosphoheptulonate synthase [Deltaproteobacteria bacterium]|nr:3-deoxy-7-phosphoheptulonate synthase [Deltaproteobacteria bacterium]MBW2317228.1 3-deoxy-7-phosphoheptulonate synthase [Deltaproteobacteria bacterium]MBW2601452.1 3-deoxy-7-phosphoheptulonate synthase [Deltaproteobacteria bacterium]OEU45848.1 MAG: 3-deoxy-7-phosphoheptulonate synthase [Desulfobacterales bacterium S7086C20]